MATKTSRGAQGGGNIRQRSDGRWEARYTVGRDPSTGKQVRKSIYGKTQKEVRQKLAVITVTVDNGTYTEPSKMRFSEWVNIWLTEYTLNLKPLTLKAYQSQINNHILPAFCNAQLDTIQPHHIQSFYNRLIEKVSAKTIKNIHGILHKIFEKAVNLGYIPTNPASNCSLPKVVKQEITPIDNSEIPAFLEAIKGDIYEPVYIIDLFTGMRQSEIIGLSWDCIDFEHGAIYLYRQLQRQKGGYYFATLKNNKSRLIKPAAFVMNMLKDLKIKQIEAQLKAGSAWDNPDNLVFTNELGHHIYHPTVLKHFKKIVERIGRPELRFHDLRHSFAVLSLQVGDDIKTVQENLGHHSAAFTMDVYAHVTDSMKKASSERMNAFINTL